MDPLFLKKMYTSKPPNNKLIQPKRLCWGSRESRPRTMDLTKLTEHDLPCSRRLRRPLKAQHLHKSAQRLSEAGPHADYLQVSLRTPFSEPCTELAVSTGAPAEEAGRGAPGCPSEGRKRSSKATFGSIKEKWRDRVTSMSTPSSPGVRGSTWSELIGQIHKQHREISEKAKVGTGSRGTLPPASFPHASNSSSSATWTLHAPPLLRTPLASAPTPSQSRPGD